jgi:hypothetical protein
MIILKIAYVSVGVTFCNKTKLLLVYHDMPHFYGYFLMLVMQFIMGQNIPNLYFFGGHSTMSWYISTELYWLLCVNDALCSRT